MKGDKRCEVRDRKIKTEQQNKRVKKKGKKDRLCSTGRDRTPCIDFYSGSNILKLTLIQLIYIVDDLTYSLLGRKNKTQLWLLNLLNPSIRNGGDC